MKHQKLLSFILAATMAISALPSAFADNGAIGEEPKTAETSLKTDADSVGEEESTALPAEDDDEPSEEEEPARDISAEPFNGLDVAENLKNFTSTDYAASVTPLNGTTTYYNTLTDAIAAAKQWQHAGIVQELRERD